jgi:zinc-binding alcohol dehydrogenase family protein
MVAVGYAASLPIREERSLFEFETRMPRPGERDLLVRVKAISVNPVDVKVRMRKQGTAAEPVILGWDAAGIVEAVGRDCSLFKPGDHVFYAGDINRAGTNAPFHVVDERIVGRKPKSIGFAHAAALPLTTITAWELLFDRIGVKRGAGADQRSLLLVGGAGGVGSIAIQLARKLTGLIVIATASREQTRDWVKGPRRPARDRSQPAVRPAAEGCGLCRRRHRACAHRHPAQCRADPGGYLAARPPRLDRGGRFAAGL